MLPFAKSCQDLFAHVVLKQLAGGLRGAHPPHLQNIEEDENMRSLLRLTIKVACSCGAQKSGGGGRRGGQPPSVAKHQVCWGVARCAAPPPLQNTE